MRIVSLLSSATEIAIALGLESSLVARSHECDYPASITSLPQCTSPRFKVTGSSGEIDALVQQTMADGRPLYQIEEALLEQLQPDIILTQAQCEVCAVSYREVAHLAETLSSKPKIVSLNPNCLADIWNDIRAIAAAGNVRPRGESLIAHLLKQMRLISSRVQKAPAQPTVACIEWIEPLMAAGNWVPELVALAGGKNLFGEAGKHSPWMTWEKLLQADADVIVVMPCGFDLPRTQQEMATLTHRPEWATLRAVREGRVWLADGNAYFNRPGPRLVEALAMLAGAFHPMLSPYRGEGFVRYQPLL